MSSTADLPEPRASGQTDFRLRCSCGTSMRVTSNPSESAERIATIFREAHQGEGHELVDPGSEEYLALETTRYVLARDQFRRQVGNAVAVADINEVHKAELADILQEAADALR